MLIMDGPILTRRATAPVTRSCALAASPRIYARDDNSAERGSRLPWQDMQNHEIRHRQRHEPVDDQDNTVTLEELTSTSSDSREETEGSDLSLALLANQYRLTFRQSW
jgi:hypothetical protein